MDVSVINLAVVAVVVITLVKLAQLVRQRFQLEKSLAAFPTAPDRHWFWGHLPKMTYDEDMYQWSREVVESLPDICKTWFGPLLVSLSVHHSNMAKCILSTSAQLRISYQQQVLYSASSGYVTGDEPMYLWSGQVVASLPYFANTWFGPLQVSLSLHHFHMVKSILSTSEPKEQYTYDLIRPWLGDGLLLSGGKKWARNRRLLTPGFHFEVLRPYAKIFQESSNTLVNKLQEACKGGSLSPREMFTDISLLTLDSLLKCIFSAESNCQVGYVRHPYIRGVVELSHLAMARFRFLPYHINLVYHLSYSGYRWRRALNDVHSYSKSVIHQRKEALKAAGGAAPDRKYIDFLDILLSAKDDDGTGLTDQEIQDEVDTFMFEGHDTTASGLSWMLYNMANNPAYQQKCREEVDELMAKKGSDQLEWDDLNQLPYLTQCLKESLRFHPPVPIVMRRLTKDIAFPDGKVAPAGTFVTIPISALHHNPAVWKEPELYDPERFSSENSKSIPPYAYVPFSAGPRNCIGQNFAMNEMKVVMANILHNFTLTVDKSIRVERFNSVVTRAKNGIHLFVKLRKC
ncbi:cytochrome P450 4F4-like [Amphiura filiformis]|uniref:cytochrome P450 4F4-like n=1 Tax=Amphiura filiformis TaxID=82378 RepID=UPI003B2277F3